MARAGRQWQMTARVLCALALLFLSFAHQPAVARQLIPAMTAQYMLPDGSIGDICFGADGVEGHNFPHEGLAPVCDYCRLTAAIDLPPPADESYLVVRVVGMAAESPDVAPFFVAHPRTLPQSRAPPLSA